jgi:spermidine synthase
VRSVFVYLIFVLSGAAGLIYEVVWARQLVLVFGNTTQAVSAILTGFFGGMAIGSVVGGRVADRVRNPLRLYGLLEIALVVVVIATPVTFRLIHEIYRGAYGTLESSPTSLALVRFALAMLALAPATVMMGATLPALTRHLSRGKDHLSSAFGRLYAANTLGAIAGTLASGLLLIEILGLTGAMLIGAVCSGLAGVVAIILARGGADPDVDWRTRRDEADALEPRTDAPTPWSRRALPLTVAFVSGLTSLGYQTLWNRLLASGTGSSTYVFTMILGVFLIGISIGAIVFAITRRWIRNPIALLALSQIGVAILVLNGLVAVIDNPPVIDASKPIEMLKTLATQVWPVVLPATIVLGLTFPASSALLEDRAAHVATATGQLLAANTLGAIAGTFLLPFVVIPAVGSPSALIGLAILNAATGLLLATVYLRAHLARVALAAGALATILALVSSVVTPGGIVDPGAARVAALGGRIDASREDEIATVQAGQLGGFEHLWVTGASMTVLTVDARLMPILPLMLRPASKTALVVAFGMGSSYRSALRAGLDVEGVELVPSVPAMFGYYYRDAEAILADPNGRLLIADGRNHVELTSRRFDIIVTDPPPPIWASGVSVISSLEYYQGGLARLSPDGVMMQWVPFGQSLEEFQAHLRTFRSVFPNVMLAAGPGHYGFFMLGSIDPLQLNDASIREVLSRPNVLDDLSSAYDSPEKTADGWISRIHSLVVVNGDDVARVAGQGPLISDDRPLPEYFLIRRLYGPPGSPLSPQLLAALASN